MAFLNDSKDNNFGYNALTGDYEDQVKAGVLDPTKVVRTLPCRMPLDRGADADYRSARGGDSGREEGRCRPRRPQRYGGHVLNQASDLAKVGIAEDSPRANRRIAICRQAGIARKLRKASS
jgi:hypothetical protein